MPCDVWFEKNITYHEGNYTTIDNRVTMGYICGAEAPQ